MAGQGPTRRRPSARVAQPPGTKIGCIDVGVGADLLAGGPGADTLIAGTGDTLVGGIQADRFVLDGLNGQTIWWAPSPGDTLVLGGVSLTPAQVRVDTAAPASGARAVLRLDRDGDGTFTDDGPAIGLSGLMPAEVVVAGTADGGTPIRLTGGARPLGDLGLAVQLSALYVGYFGRAADPAGQAYWLDAYERALEAGQGASEPLTWIAASFRVSDEAVARFPVLAPAADSQPDRAAVQGFLGTAYASLFSRGPDAGGLGS